MKAFESLRRLMVTACLWPAVAAAQQTLQPGFYSHEPAGVGLRIDNARSGELCTAPGGTVSICDTSMKITVIGRDTCEGNGGQRYPCTRYGYSFDYRGAEPGETLDCEVTRKTAFREHSANYSVDLESSSGHVSVPTRIGFRPVEKRTLLSEVHRCSYRGEPFASIEYMLWFEPEYAAAVSVEPVFEEVPDACGLTVEPGEGGLYSLGQPSHDDPRVEHIPMLQSHCIFKTGGGSPRYAGFLFKFMLYELFDVANLDPVRLNFNATFTSGGVAPKDTLPDLGKTSFVYESSDRTTLTVITGIQGPPDFAGRPREFIASYYIDDPDTTHAEKIDDLIEIAERHLRAWHSR